ncbi:MAG: hypothetical protein PHV34_10270 [Verrucomicrobiae bacterium]|nr:hypothetical protein [Verrucomicrobiae bacterium]
MNRKDFRNENQDAKGRLFTGIFLLAIFLSLLLASISPQIHKFLHKEAGLPGHHCGVTLVLSGAAEASSSIVHVAGAAFAGLISAGWMDAPVCLSVFLSTGIVEHAPPFPV